MLRHVFEEIVPFNACSASRSSSIDPAAPKLRFDMRPDLIGNPRRQMLHGGVISAVLDVTAGIAIHLAVAQQKSESTPRRVSFPNIGTINLHVDYLRPGRGNYFIATGPRGAARQSRRGRTDGVGERFRRTDRDRECRVYGFAGVGARVPGAAQHAMMRCRPRRAAGYLFQKDKATGVPPSAMHR